MHSVSFQVPKLLAAEFIIRLFPVSWCTCIHFLAVYIILGFPALIVSTCRFSQNSSLTVHMRKHVLKAEAASQRGAVMREEAKDEKK
jgi:hypothetical protein